MFCVIPLISWRRMLVCSKLWCEKNKFAKQKWKSKWIVNWDTCCNPGLQPALRQKWRPHACLQKSVKIQWDIHSWPKKTKIILADTNVGVCDGGTLPETSNGTHTQRSKGTKLRRHQATYRTSYGTNLAADYVHWIVYSWHSSRNLQQNTEPNRGGSRLKTLGTKCQSTTPGLITQAQGGRYSTIRRNIGQWCSLVRDKGSGGLCMTLIRGSVGH